MIKNIYDRKFNTYHHRYYCDDCKKLILGGSIFRNEDALKNEYFDLCSKCKFEWDKKEIGLEQFKCRDCEFDNCDKNLVHSKTYLSCKECGSIGNKFYSSDINNGLVCRECYDKRRDI